MRRLFWGVGGLVIATGLAISSVGTCKLHRSVLQRSQVKMRAPSQRPYIAEYTAIAIAAARGAMAVVTAAASAIAADI